jgi:hypothetical protein
MAQELEKIRAKAHPQDPRLGSSGVGVKRSRIYRFSWIVMLIGLVGTIRAPLRIVLCHEAKRAQSNHTFYFDLLY